MTKSSSPSNWRSSVGQLLVGLVIAAVMVVFRGGFAPATGERQQARDSAAHFVASTPHQTPAGVLRASAPVVARSSLTSSTPPLLPARDAELAVLNFRGAGAREHFGRRPSDTIGLRGYDAAAPPFGL
jgi:hypothetical protein